MIIKISVVARPKLINKGSNSNEKRPADFTVKNGKKAEQVNPPLNFTLFEFL
jgi:hypothetical protein